MNARRGAHFGIAVLVPALCGAVLAAEPSITGPARVIDGDTIDIAGHRIRLVGIDAPATFHILRHTYASHLATNGVPIAAMAAILAHGDPRMTEKHYAHLLLDHVALTLRANAPKLGIVGVSNV